MGVKLLVGIITRMREKGQKAVYWSVSGHDQYGQPTFNAGVELNVRWEEKAEQFLDDRGEMQVSNAVIYVDRDMGTEDLLYEGELDDLTAAAQANPHHDDAPATIYEVRKFNRIPNLRNTEKLRFVHV